MGNIVGVPSESSCSDYCSSDIGSNLTEKYDSAKRGHDRSYDLYSPEKKPPLGTRYILENDDPLTSDIYNISDLGSIQTNIGISAVEISHHRDQILLGYSDGFLKKIHSQHAKFFHKGTGKCKALKNIGQIFDVAGVSGLAITQDDLCVLVSSSLGALKQVRIKDAEVIADYGQIHHHRINCMSFGAGDRCLYIGSDFGHWFGFDCSNRSVLFYDVIIGAKEIKIISYAKKRNVLLVVDSDGNLSQYSRVFAVNQNKGAN
jgi:hypothetical protein